MARWPLPLMDAIAQRPELGLRVSGYVGSEPPLKILLLGRVGR